MRPPCIEGGFGKKIYESFFFAKPSFKTPPNRKTPALRQRCAGGRVQMFWGQFFSLFRADRGRSKRSFWVLSGTVVG